MPEMCHWRGFWLSLHTCACPVLCVGSTAVDCYSFLLFQCADAESEQLAVSSSYTLTWKTGKVEPLALKPLWSKVRTPPQKKKNYMCRDGKEGKKRTLKAVVSSGEPVGDRKSRRERERQGGGRHRYRKCFGMGMHLGSRKSTPPLHLKTL